MAVGTALALPLLRRTATIRPLSYMQPASYSPASDPLDAHRADGLEGRAGYGRRFRLGPWLVEPLRHALLPAPEPPDRVDEAQVVRLEPKVMHVLVVLAQRAGEPVTKAAFMAEVWGDTVVTDDVLARCISELRKALGDDPRAPTFVETIRKVGYRLVAPVTWLPAPSASAHLGSRLASRPPIAARPDTSDAASGRVVRIAVAGMAVALALVALLWGLGEPEPAPLPVRQTLPLTSFPGAETDPAISPDRAQVVFAWNAGSRLTRNLYLKQPGADTPLRLTSTEAHDHSPAWSPDSRFVAFARRAPDGTHSVRVVSSIGGTDRVVLDAGRRAVHGLAWPPDSTDAALIVALETAPLAPAALYRVPLDANADSLVQLTRPPAFGPGDRFPAVAPDGRRLAFARGIAETQQDVAVIDLAGGPARRVTADSSRITGLTWEADGAHVLVASERSGTSALWRVRLADGATEHVLDASDGGTLTRPSVDASGEYLAYAEHTSNVNVWEVTPAAPSYRAVPLLTSTRYDGAPSYAPDGERVAFVSERAGPPNVWLRPAEAGAPVQLTDLGAPEVAQPRWSPDGTALAFAARVGGNLDVYLLDAAGGAARRVTSHPSDDDAPAWSEDGRTLYFASTRSGRWEVFRQPAAGASVPEQVTFGGGRAGQPLGDGTTLLYVRPDTMGLWARPLQSGTDPILPVALGVPPVGGSALPDTTTAELVVGDLAPRDYGNWAITRSGLLYVAREAGLPVLRRYRHDGTSERLHAINDLAPGAQLSAHPSGDRFLYGRVDREESDVLLVEHYRMPEPTELDR